MRRVVSLLMLVGLATAVSPPALAQAQAGELALKVEDIDATNHPEVSVTISLPQELVGAVIDGFTVLEEGQVRDVTAEPLSAEDLEVVLVLDLSGSMKGAPLAAAKQAVADFTERLPDGVTVAVVAFHDGAEVVADFTTDHEAIVAQTEALDVSGDTALYDGLITAAELFVGRPEARRSLVVLTDGGDTASEATLEDAIIGLLGSGASFYAVALQSPEADHEPLNRLGTATSGTVVPADDPEALIGIFDEIATELVNRYLLTFMATGNGATSIDISVAGEGIVAAAGRVVSFPSLPPPPAIEPPPPPPPPPSTVAAPVPTTLPPLREATMVTPGAMSQPWVLNAGAAAVFIGLTGVGVAIHFARRDGQLATRSRKRRKKKDGDSALTGLTNRATLFAEQKMEKRQFGSKLSSGLEQAGIMLRPGEFMLLALATSLLAAALGSLTFGFVRAALLGALVAVGFRGFVGLRGSRRKAAFATQLPDTLQLIGGGLRAGYGLLQAVDSVATEALSPTSEELRRLVIEVNLGRDLTEALRALASRVESDDFGWVVDAIEIHRQVGGDLAEILDSVSTTIRDRAQIRRRIKALSAEGRLSAVILLSLPFLVGIAITLTNPEYMGELTGSAIGKLMIAVGIFLMFVGTGWMRRIIRLKY